MGVWTLCGLARPSRPSNLPTDVLLPQLVNLGLVLNDLEHRNEWTRFNELMQKFLPRFKRLSTKVSAGSVQVYLHEEGLSVPVPATRLSDRTLRFLLAILLNPGSATTICIEEPELGLHPDAMSLLAELLVEAAGKTQLIVTTHSDTLVSELTEEAESVLVCDYGRNGTELRRLEAAKLKFWPEKYRLGGGLASWQDWRQPMTTSIAIYIGEAATPRRRAPFRTGMSAFLKPIVDRVKEAYQVARDPVWWPQGRHDAFVDAAVE